MERSPGPLLAAFLRGIWRQQPCPTPLSEGNLDCLTPLLLRSGAGGLGWSRVRQTALRFAPAAIELHQAYRFHALRAALYEQAVQRYVSALQAAGIDVLLFKGWAIARLYPESALRPYGDIDLVVAPGHYASAAAVLQGVRFADCDVDLHPSLGSMSDHAWESLYARAHIISLRGVNVRILAPEDHLVLLCRHFLRHNAWRPLWLCDIAAALEARQADFDWGLCLGSNRRRAGWVTCTLGLAAQLLDAHVEDTPIASHANHLPSWLKPAVLRQWDRCVGPGHLGTIVRYVTSHWRQPRHLLRHARQRWDMPTAATFALRAPLNAFPRSPFQLALALTHIPAWCQQLWHHWAGNLPLSGRH
jgi:Uncharacterised nucleotidyltransferase